MKFLIFGIALVSACGLGQATKPIRISLQSTDPVNIEADAAHAVKQKLFQPDSVFEYSAFRAGNARSKFITPKKHTEKEEPALITKPIPGQEYVSFASVGSVSDTSRNSKASPINIPQGVEDSEVITAENSVKSRRTNLNELPVSSKFEEGRFVDEPEEGLQAAETRTRSKIEIKEVNGALYEYEYIYYYDEDPALVDADVPVIDDQVVNFTNVDQDLEQATFIPTDVPTVTAPSTTTTTQVPTTTSTTTTPSITTTTTTEASTPHNSIRISRPRGRRPTQDHLVNEISSDPIESSSKGRVNLRDPENEPIKPEPSSSRGRIRLRGGSRGATRTPKKEPVEDQINTESVVKPVVPFRPSRRGSLRPKSVVAVEEEPEAKPAKTPSRGRGRGRLSPFRTRNPEPAKPEIIVEDPIEEVPVKRGRISLNRPRTRGRLEPQPVTQEAKEQPSLQISPKPARGNRRLRPNPTDNNVISPIHIENEQLPVNTRFPPRTTTPPAPVATKDVLKTSFEEALYTSDIEDDLTYLDQEAQKLLSSDLQTDIGIGLPDLVLVTTEPTGIDVESTGRSADNLYALSRAIASDQQLTTAVPDTDAYDTTVALDYDALYEYELSLGELSALDLLTTEADLAYETTTTPTTTTTTTTSTTTTTTTPTPTTAAPVATRGRGRFRGRGARIRGQSNQVQETTTTTTTSAPTTKSSGRRTRPRPFRRRRPGQKGSSQVSASEAEITAETQPMIEETSVMKEIEDIPVGSTQTHKVKGSFRRPRPRPNFNRFKPQSKDLVTDEANEEPKTNPLSKLAGGRRRKGQSFQPKKAIAEVKDQEIVEETPDTMVDEEVPAASPRPTFGSRRQSSRRHRFRSSGRSRLPETKEQGDDIESAGVVEAAEAEVEQVNSVVETEKVIPEPQPAARSRFSSPRTRARSSHRFNRRRPAKVIEEDTTTIATEMEKSEGLFSSIIPEVQEETKNEKPLDAVVEPQDTPTSTFNGRRSFGRQRAPGSRRQRLSALVGSRPTTVDESQPSETDETTGNVISEHLGNQESSATNEEVPVEETASIVPDISTTTEKLTRREMLARRRSKFHGRS